MSTAVSLDAKATSADASEPLMFQGTSSLHKRLFSKAPLHRQPFSARYRPDAYYVYSKTQSFLLRQTREVPDAPPAIMAHGSADTSATRVGSGLDVISGEDAVPSHYFLCVKGYHPVLGEQIFPIHSDGPWDARVTHSGDARTLTVNTDLANARLCETRSNAHERITLEKLVFERQPHTEDRNADLSFLPSTPSGWKSEVVRGATWWGWERLKDGVVEKAPFLPWDHPDRYFVRERQAIKDPPKSSYI